MNETTTITASSREGELAARPRPRPPLTDQRELVLASLVRRPPGQGRRIGHDQRMTSGRAV